MPAPRPPLTPRKGYALIALAATSWGTWSLILRPAEALGPLSPELEAFFLLAFISIATLPFAIVESRRHEGARRARWPLILPGITDAAQVLLFFRAMKAGPLAVAVLTHCSAPILVAAISPLVTSERFRPRVLVAVLAAMLGLTMLLEPWRDLAPGALSAALFGGASAVFYCANVLVQKRLADVWGSAELLAYHSIPSALIVAVAVPAGGFAIRGDQAVYLTVGGVVPGVLAGLAFLRGLRVVPASHAALMALLEPTVAVLLGIVWWREPMRPLAAVGALVVLASVASAVFERPPAATRS